MIEFIIGLILVISAAIFAYGSAHIEEEQRQGRGLNLPWEKQKGKSELQAKSEYIGLVFKIGN